MPLGIANATTNITMHNITEMINLTTGDPIEFVINVNHIAYGGWFFFILMVVLGFVLWRLAQTQRDQPLVNIMYVSAALTILSFFLRAIYVVKKGVTYALVSDVQMWVFPLITILSAGIIRFLHKD